MSRALVILETITVMPTHRHSPDLNPVDRVWLHLRERSLFLCVLDDCGAILDACCAALSALVAEPGRIQSPCDDPWIRKVSS